MPDKCKYVWEAKQISNKIDEGRTAFKKHLGIVQLPKFSHPVDARSAININEPKIIVVKYIKQNLNCKDKVIKSQHNGWF